VETIKASRGGELRITNIERTLIDVTVRPFYSGGVKEVQKFDIKARGKISVDKLVSILRKINHVYPYHQAIGFYMERAGFERSALTLLKKTGLKYDFYLDYGMNDKNYSKEWRIYFPKELVGPTKDPSH
jgi:predicted transcriptional regulator of viral defense system